MTAPNTGAPASPGSPAAPESADAYVRMSDADLMADLGLTPGAAEGEGEQGEQGGQQGAAPAAEPARNKAGRAYDPATGKLLPEGEAAPAGDEAAVAGAEGEGEGEGEEVREVESALSREERIAKHGFALFDEEGDLEIPEGVKVVFKGNGKVREVDFPTLIRHAQNGAYNEAVHAEARELRTVRDQQVPQLEGRIGELEQANQAQIALARRLFEDPEFYTATRQRYMAQNTPEARLERDRAALANERQQEQLSREARQAEQYVAQELEPVMAQLLQQFPTVTFEEAFGRFSLLTAPMLVNGRIPLNRLPDVHRLLEGEIGPWMALRHEERNAARAKDQEGVAAAKREAQVTTAKAKRALARVVAPRGSAPAAGRQQATPRKVVTADDGVAAILDEVRGSAQ